VSSWKALVPLAIQPSGRVYAEPGFFYLVDTSLVAPGTVVFALPPVVSTEPSDHLIIKKISSDSGTISVTPWYSGDLINAQTAAWITSGVNQSHHYVPGCPASYGGALGWVSW
jgi:hypothetical protein